MIGTASGGTIREPAVAGLFYEADTASLAKQVDRYLNSAPPRPISDVRGLISPHAGYPFSGPVAAYGYRLLRGADINTVIVLAPSHYAVFSGAALQEGEGFRTPLGLVEISPRAESLAGKAPFVVEKGAMFERPPWWRSSSKTPPPPSHETPHTWEHALEVQIPFLQRTLDDFRIIPVVMGKVDAESVAEALLPILDEKTLVVASTDLSHYHDYHEANRRDGAACEAILALDAGRFSQEEACGSGPVLVLMSLARRLGWKPELLDYRNSGDTEGNKSQVVGYAAIVFHAPKKQEETGRDKMKGASHPSGIVEPCYDPAQRRLLLDLARRTIVDAVEQRSYPRIDPESIPEGLKEDRSCFVTLTKSGTLRGCIGGLSATEPLWMAVMHMARAAALEDTRFQPVGSDELSDLHVEISILSSPEKLEYASSGELLGKLRPGVDGVILKSGWRRATFLPQVWDQLPSKEEFLSRLCSKAGLNPDAWEKGRLEVEVYQVEAFSEKSP